MPPTRKSLEYFVCRTRAQALRVLNSNQLDTQEDPGAYQVDGPYDSFVAAVNGMNKRAAAEQAGEVVPPTFIAPEADPS